MVLRTLRTFRRCRLTRLLGVWPCGHVLPVSCSVMDKNSCVERIRSVRIRCHICPQMETTHSFLTTKTNSSGSHGDVPLGTKVRASEPQQLFISCCLLVCPSLFFLPSLRSVWNHSFSTQRIGTHDLGPGGRANRMLVVRPGAIWRMHPELHPHVSQPDVDHKEQLLISY